MSVKIMSLVEQEIDAVWSHSVRHNLVSVLGSNGFVQHNGWIRYVGKSDICLRADAAKKALTELLRVYENAILEPDCMPFPSTRKVLYEVHKVIIGLWQVLYLAKASCGEHDFSTHVRAKEEL